MCVRSIRRPMSSGWSGSCSPPLCVTSPADAERVLQWHALRWRIEDYFRILKSGCKVEELQHHTAERLDVRFS